MKGRRQGQRGFALIDVLVALLIASISLLAVLGGVALSARAARFGRQKLVEIVTARNENALHRKLSFIPEIIPK